MRTPWDGYRRQAEWDDHGETYPLVMDGPDLWYLLEIRHEGVFKLGMYFLNKDGQDGNNRLRDYMIEIYPASLNWTSFDDVPQFAHDAESQVSKNPPLAKNRVLDFWGGVHKQFVVKGPSKYYVKIDRNYSFNTIASLVAIDRMSGSITEDEKRGLPLMFGIRYNAPNYMCDHLSERIQPALEIIEKYDKCLTNTKMFFTLRKDILNCFRVASEENFDSMSKNLSWLLCLWRDGERAEFTSTMHQAWGRLAETNPDYVRLQQLFLRQVREGTWKSPWENLR